MMMKQMHQQNLAKKVRPVLFDGASTFFDGGPISALAIGGTYRRGGLTPYVGNEIWLMDFAVEAAAAAAISDSDFGIGRAPGANRAGSRR
eukprot:7183914-Karenia_brevis.AAC.1